MTSSDWMMKICLLVTAFVLGFTLVEGELKRVNKCTIHGERCKFPFTRNGKSFDECTTEGVKNNRPWCPTEIYADGSADLSYCDVCWADQRCYLKARSFPDKSWILSCPPGCVYAQRKMYGTNNEYSADSYICAAAIHEGLIKNDTGGDVIFAKKDWKAPFLARDVKNNVSSKVSKKEKYEMMSFEGLFDAQKVFKTSRSQKLVFSHDKTSISMLASGSTKYQPLIEDQKYTTGVAVDVRNRKIYWIDMSQRAIWTANFDGNKVTNKKKIIDHTKLIRPENLAVDWVHGNLFWTDSGSNTVGVAKVTGEDVGVLKKGDKDYSPRGLAVDPKNGFVYVTDFGKNPKIERCSMSVKDDCKTLVKDEIAWPSGIALDIDENRMCWTDRKIPLISCSNTDGSSRRNMKFADGRLEDPFAIIMLNNRVYWTDWVNTGVLSSNYLTWDDLFFHVGELENPSGLAIFDIAAQKMYPNQCTRAKCDNLCMPSQNGAKCLCKNGPHSDGKNCGDQPAEPKPKNILDIYVADFSNIRRYKVDLDSRQTDTKTVLSRLDWASTVAIDTVKETIYWSVTISKKIESAKLSEGLATSQRRTFLDNTEKYLGKVEGIAIDSISRLLYWTDISSNAVYVTNLDPTDGPRQVTILVKGDSTYKPRAIALDPVRGYMYIINSARPNKIQKCETSSTPKCQYIVTSAILQANWITIDHEENRLYFSDSVLRKIESCDLNGKNRKVILSGKPLLELPYAIGIHKDRVYWNDRTFRRLMSADKTTGKDQHILSRSLTQPMGMVLYDPKNPAKYPNSCEGNTCQHMCLPSPLPMGRRRYSCVCPEKFKGVSPAAECKVSGSKPPPTRAPVTPAPVTPAPVRPVVCGTGFENSRRDPTQCIDVNECEIRKGGCQDICENIPGSFTCKCNNGRQLGNDGKSCKDKEICSPNPCKNGGTCNKDGSNFVCFCIVGFKGKTCEEVDVRLEPARPYDPEKTIRLQCLSPPNLRAVIVWRKNRVQIDFASQWASIEEEGKLLVIYRPHYTYSGVYTCQVGYKQKEYQAEFVVKIPKDPKSICGKAPGMDIPERTIVEKVYGGKLTRANMAPFMAMLYKKSEGIKTRRGVFCGGSVVTTKHVVTAAHCFKQVAHDEITVYVGKRDTRIAVIETHQQQSDVEKIIEHDEYNPKTLDVDIAIIILKSPIYWTEAVKPICIAMPEDKDKDKKARQPNYGIVFGWGLVSGGDNARFLREVKLPIVKQDVCKKTYKISTTMFCAGGEFDKDACEGDSGGPFTLWSKKEQAWYLGGIVSWGHECGKEGKPGVYTRIGTMLRRWIHEKTKM